MLLVSVSIAFCRTVTVPALSIGRTILCEKRVTLDVLVPLPRIVVLVPTHTSELV
jgi:hypothetical protein